KAEAFATPRESWPCTVPLTVAITGRQFNRSLTIPFLLSIHVPPTVCHVSPTVWPKKTASFCQKEIASSLCSEHVVPACVGRQCNNCQGPAARGDSAGKTTRRACVTDT